MKASAEQNIIHFLQTNGGKYAAAELQRMLFKNKNGTYASPKAISRRLQENAEEGGLLQVSYENGNAYYEYRKEKLPKKQVVSFILKDGQEIAQVSYQ